MENVMDVKNIHIGEIVPYAKNAKKHDKRQIDNVAESIRQYGFVQPVERDMHKFIQRQQRKGGDYGKNRETSEGDRSKTI